MMNAMRFGLGLIADGMPYRELGCGLGIQRMLFRCEFTRALSENTLFRFMLTSTFNGRMKASSNRSAFSCFDSRLIVNVTIPSPYKVSDKLIPKTYHTPTSLPLRNSAISCCSSAPLETATASVEVPPDGYRRNFGICLINLSNQIFDALRLKLNIPNAWQMPQGGIDEGGIPRDAVIRELREETGVQNVPYWLTYNVPPNVRKKLNRWWRSDWKSLAQKWFLLRVKGK